MPTTTEAKAFTIFEALRKIHTKNWVIPSFQRSYVWNKEQIEKLWDSIMVGYPISTFLFWKIGETLPDGSRNTLVDEYTIFYSFIKQALFKQNKTIADQDDGADITYDDYVFMDENENHPNDYAVLDGQQRLTSLYLSLVGKCFVGRKDNSRPIKLCVQLDENCVSEENNEDGLRSKTFGIKFCEASHDCGPVFEFSKIIVLRKTLQNPDTRIEEIEKIVLESRTPTPNYAKDVLTNLFKKIFDEKIINAQVLTVGTEDEALEMFIRFNNGGTPLKKNDIIASTIDAYWKGAQEELLKVVSYKNNKAQQKKLEPEFTAYKDFGLGFIVRAATMLFSDNVQANINFEIVNQLKTEWENFKESLINLENFLLSINGLRVAEFHNRWNVLLPILYLIHKNPSRYQNYRNGVEAYLSRAIVLMYFQNGTTAKLTKLKRAMDANHDQYGYPTMPFDILDDIDGDKLRITDEKLELILNSQYGSKLTNSVLELLDASWMEVDEETKMWKDYDVDHLHPRVSFGGHHPISIDAATWERWGKMSNQLPNLNFDSLNKVKSDTPLAQYVANIVMDANHNEYIQRSLLRDDAGELPLDLEHFEEFYNRRKSILKDALCKLLHYHPEIALEDF